MAFLATSRSRRSNAGANMSKLLDKEEEAMNAEDDFYKTHYGGFEEVENDSDFDDSNSSDSENVIDSDFDIDETQVAPAQDDEEATEKALQVEERESRQKRNVYRDPKARNAKQKVLTKKRSTPSAHPVPSTSSSSSSTPTTTRPHRKKNAIVPKAPTTPSYLFDDVLDLDASPISRSLRKSTQKSSKEIRDLLDERKRSKKNKKKVKHNDFRPLTQEEMLREAKKTEVENTKSLLAYKNLEIEKVKKVKPSKQAPNVPMIRYHSYTEYEDNVGDKANENQAPQKYSRTVITFPSEESLRAHFPSYKPAEPETLKSIVVNSSKMDTDSAGTSKFTNGDAAESPEQPVEPPIVLPKKRSLCPITNQTAKFFDPLTQLPYANAQAFSIIRNNYSTFLQKEFANMQNDPRLVKFVEQTKTNYHLQMNEKRVVQFNTANGAPIKVTSIKPTTGAATTNLTVTRRPSTTVSVVHASSLPPGPITGVSGSIGTTTTTNTPMSLPFLTLQTGSTIPSGTKFFIHSGSTGNQQIIIQQPHAQQILQQQQRQAK